MKRLIIALSGLAVLAAAPASTPDPQQVVAAERTFAADAAAHGWVGAFRRHHAPGATMLSPGPADADAVLAEIPGEGGTGLKWRPAFAGIARSGDLGFTTGPIQIGDKPDVVGHYFTVWQRQPDGGWKWIFDAGTDVVDTAPIAVDAPVPTLPVAAKGAASPEAAKAAVAGIEEAGALAAHLAADARVHRVGAPRAIGQADAAALMAADGAVTLHTLKREASAGGDLVFSLGEVRDTANGTERLRYFARIWQLRPEGWQIVFDEIVPRRG